MIRSTPEQIRRRAEGLAARVTSVKVEVVAGESVIGGGSTPEQSLPTWLLSISGDAVALESRLRKSDPPVLARIGRDALLLDLRTVFPEEEEELLAALQALS